MDQASASPEASCAHNPVAPRTSSCSRSVDRSRTGGLPHARSGPQCEPHAAPSNRDSRPSSPAPCRLKAKGYLLPEFYSGATGRSGRFNEGLLLRRLQPSENHAAIVTLNSADAKVGQPLSATSVAGVNRRQGRREKRKN